MVDQNKEQFLSTLQLERFPSDAVQADPMRDVNHGLRRGTIRLVWGNPPANGVLPALLVIPESDWREFFAWTNTYLGGWRPITSLFRVIADRNLAAALGERPNHDAIWEYRNAVLGMILGEAAMHGGERGGHDERGVSFSLVECASTCSFVIGRSVYLGRTDLLSTVDAWQRAHVAIRRMSFESDVESPLAPWSTLLEVGGVSKTARWGTRSVSEAVAAICQTLHTHDEINSAGLAELTRGSPEMARAFRLVNEPRERRVQALDMALRSLGERRRRSSQPAVIALGLLASRIAPGSLDHMALIRPYVARMQGLALWYGLFSGMTRGARLIDRYENVGRRILRDMRVADGVLASPNCDIAVDELEIISTSESLLQNLPRASGEQLVIEVLPCVNTTAPWLTKEPSTSPAQQSFFDDETRRLESDVSALNHAAETLLRRLRRLGRASRR